VVFIEGVNSCGCNGNLTSGIAKLSNGEEWLPGEGGHNVAQLGSTQQSMDVKFCIVCGMHEHAIVVLNGDGFVGNAIIVQGCIYGEKVSHASSVGYSNSCRMGRRTCCR